MSRKPTYYRSASVAALATLPVILGCALLGATGAKAATCTVDLSGCDPFVVTFQQEGSNIVATGSGEFDFTGLTPTLIGSFTSSIFPSAARLAIGQPSDTDLYTVSSAPPNFGPGGNTNGLLSGEIGTQVAINPTFVAVSTGYASGTDITSSATFSNTTLAGLGVTPGEVFRWTWGSAPDQSFTIDTTPLPGTLPLFATGLGALGLLGWRRKRRAQAVA